MIELLCQRPPPNSFAAVPHYYLPSCCTRTSLLSIETHCLTACSLANKEGTQFGWHGALLIACIHSHCASFSLQPYIQRLRDLLDCAADTALRSTFLHRYWLHGRHDYDWRRTVGKGKKGALVRKKSTRQGENLLLPSSTVRAIATIPSHYQDRFLDWIKKAIK